MARYGFKNFGPPAPSIEVAVGAADADMGRRYGLSDPETAKKRGYHLPETPEPSRWEPAKGAEEAVFTGTGPEVAGGTYKGEKIPEGGCRGEVKRQLPMPQTPIVADAESRAFLAAKDDASVKEKIAQWSACMKKRGFDIKSPIDEVAPLGVDVNSQAPSAREIEVAVADVECKSDTKLVDFWHKNEESKQQQEIAKGASALTKERDNKNNVVNKAAQAYEAQG
ncbi:hypothetical protein [Streptomyces sp. NRRL S-241]|uniref:hypothetical protein n=1 Tax=Streptomyces sp. NRRL S-241 TaxID=1463896 RepID=UPI00131AEC90|nr:hypothetical protein [Streptomyces sp. NRRL S-241]